MSALLLLLGKYWREVAIGGLALALALAGWASWVSHDHTLVAQGVSQCLQATTTTKEASNLAAKNTELTTAADVDVIVDAYDQKVLALQHDTDDLAQQLHDARLRTNSAASSGAGHVSGVSAPAGFVCRPDDTAGPSAADRREADLREQCAAAILEVNAIRAAWIKAHEDSVKAQP